MLSTVGVFCSIRFYNQHGNKFFYETIENMKNAKKLSAYGMVLMVVALLASCSNDEPSPTGTVNLAMVTSGNNTITTSGRTKGTVEITDFQISIRDVIFKTDVDDDGISDDSTEVAFNGPYQLDLLNGADAIAATIGSAVIPNGIYEELRFKFHKDTDLASTAPLYDRSIFIAGNIDGTPFEMWHDTSENLDIGKNSGGVVVNDNVVNLTVNFTIEQFLSSVVAIDLSQAVDGNQDGLIEINPDNDDGNGDFADALKENIKGAADLLDE